MTDQLSLTGPGITQPSLAQHARELYRLQIELSRLRWTREYQPTLRGAERQARIEAVQGERLLHATALGLHLPHRQQTLISLRDPVTGVVEQWEAYRDADLVQVRLVQPEPEWTDDEEQDDQASQPWGTPERRSSASGA